MKPAVGTKCKFTAKLKGSPEDGDAKFEIAFVNDLAPLASAANLDDRVPTIRECKYWSDDLVATISGNKAEVEVDSTVPHDAWESTNPKEIYACIRAEYKYIGEGYLKVQSRVGSNGIDHLFVQGDDAVLVESKTSSDFTHVSNLIRGRNPDSVLAMLGKGRQFGTNPQGQVLFATQMSMAWVNDCLQELEQTSPASEQRAVMEVRRNMKNGKPPKRILNVYGGLNWNAHGLYTSLVAEARRQFATLPPEEKQRVKRYVDSKYVRGTTTGEKTGGGELIYLNRKWISADRKKAHFFLLPGKYRLRVRAAQFTRVKENPQEIDFADEQFRNDEFFEIDALALLVPDFEKLKP